MARQYSGYEGNNKRGNGAITPGTRKYNSQLCASPDGKRFASKAEMARYEELTKMLMRGEIEDLELQVVYRIDHNGVHICKYLADFRYVQDGQVIVEDVKGVSTPVYQLKKKMMLAFHGVNIEEWKGRTTKVKRSNPGLEG